MRKMVCTRIWLPGHRSSAIENKIKGKHKRVNGNENIFVSLMAGG